MSFCTKNRRFLFTFRTKDCLPPLSFRFHLFFHSILNCCRRNNVFQFHTVDFDSPWVCRLIQGSTHLCIDRFSGCQCLVEFQITDDVSKCCSRQVFDRHDWILDSVGIELWICDLKVNYGVDLHGNIIFRDDRLRRKIHNLFLQVNSSCHTINERDLDVKPYRPRFLECSQTFHHIGICLRNDPDAGKHRHDDNKK